MTARGILGETLSQDRRIHTPTASEFAAGIALDAGTIQIIDSNLSWVAVESLHDIGNIIGPGQLYASAVGRGYAGLNDLAQPDNPTRCEKIAWNISTAAALGPFDLTIDRVAADGNQPRKVKVMFDCSGGGASSLTVLAAITSGFVVPTNEECLAFAEASVTGASQTVLTLTPRRFDYETPTMQTGTASIDQSFPGAFANLYVWCGWYATNAADTIYSISAWEQR